MATPSSHAMPEHWTELNASRRQRALCSERVAALKGRCRQDCGKATVADCPSCHGKLMDLLRSRYSESEDREWFSHRRAFLHELDGLFQDAKDRKRTLGSIEARIESEKEAWYRWVLRRYPEFIAVSDRGVDRDEIRRMLDDPDRSRDELVQTMLDGIGKPLDPDWPAAVDDFARRVEAAGPEAAALKQLYMAEFFTNRSTGQVLDNAAPYLAEYRAAGDGTALEHMMDKIVADLQRSRSAQPQRDRHSQRLDELRRARTAFEQNRMQARSRKGAGAQAAAAAAAAGGADADADPDPELYDLPPCLVCGRDVPTSDVFSCTVCQAVKQAGGDAELTVYCSEDCYRKGHHSHVDAAHDCEAANNCVQLSHDDDDEDDGHDARDATPATAVCCTDCLHHSKQATLYCSERCALANIAKHRLAKHHHHHQHERTATRDNKDKHEQEPRRGVGLVRPLRAFVEATLVGRNPGLEMRMVD
ncbi:hypothetical protein E4U41_003682 [Claviceps citrina]|nr:hypothetical protein E4U41_003682 [Claviceps citrina]